MTSYASQPAPQWPASDPVPPPFAETPPPGDDQQSVPGPEWHTGPGGDWQPAFRQRWQDEPTGPLDPVGEQAPARERPAGRLREQVPARELWAGRLRDQAAGEADLGATAPGTTAPGTTAPGTTAPGAAALAAAAPGAAGPAATGLGAPDPSTAGPGAPPGDRYGQWAVLSYLGVPFLGFLLPLAVYLITPQASAFTRRHAAQALNLSITVLLYDLSALILGGLLALDTVEVAVLIMVPLLAALWIVTLVYLVLAAAAASRGGYYRLPSWLCAALVR